MEKLGVSDLIQIYAFPRQDMTNFMMKVYDSDENYFKVGDIFLPIVTITGAKMTKQAFVDARALKNFENLYYAKTGHHLQYRKGGNPLKVAEQKMPKDKTRKK